MTKQLAAIFRTDVWQSVISRTRIETIREAAHAWVGRWLLAALALGLLLGGRQAMADVALINDRYTQTLLYEVSPTDQIPTGTLEVECNVSAPISLPTTNAPVMVMTSTVDPLLSFPDHAFGSAGVTLTHHPYSGGFTPSGALSWSGVDATGHPSAGLVSLPNDGDDLSCDDSHHIIAIARDGSVSLHAGPKPGQIYVVGGKGRRGSIIRVRLIW